jgi:hypothetical protein
MKSCHDDANSSLITALMIRQETYVFRDKAANLDTATLLNCDVMTQKTNDK